MAASSSLLQAPPSVLGGVNENFSRLLAVLEIDTLEKLILYFPARHDDRAQVDSISGAFERALQDEGEVTTLILQCADTGSFHFREREIRRFTFTDGKDMLSVSAWNPAHRFFRTGQWYILSGKLKRHLKEIQLNLLDYSLYDEDLESLDHGRIVPIYPSTEGLSQKRIRQAVHLALALLKEEGYAYRLPPSILKKKGFADKLAHIETVHFPETREALNEARAALVYEEFFIFQKALVEKSIGEKSGKEKNRYREHAEVDLFLSKIPFALTESQKRTFEEIKNDLKSPFAMHRLLHGEVGSGKTLVALLAMLYAAAGGAQAAIMAPTDLLARQHQKTFEAMLRPLGLESTFLAAGLKGPERAEALRKIREGEAKFVVGTHSLFQEEVGFLNLG
ncbi:MAG: DEAD/DEAH box helicase, partial [Spirochaetia bacterium]|nr:DEAD/DEAH box helicase [Spirochaetia bacterium]